MMSERVKHCLEAVGVGLAFFVLASASVLYTRFDGSVAFLWVATAPLLAFMAVRPPRAWVPALIAAGLASWASATLFGVGAIRGIPIAITIVGEALLSATLLRRLGREITRFENLASVSLFTLVTGVIAPALSGIPASILLSSPGGHEFGSVWCGWFAAHALGTITFAPLLLLIAGGHARRWALSAPVHRKIEAAALLAIVGATSFEVFYQEHRPLLFLPFLPILLATFRLGRLGASVSVVLLAAVGGVLTVKGHGPVYLMHASSAIQAQFFQFYLAVAVLMVLPVAAELKRREHLFLRMQESEASYRLLAENIGDTIIQTTAKGVVRFVSPAVLELTGYDAAAVIGRNSSDFVFPEDLPNFDQARSAALSDPEQTVTVEYRASTRSRGVEWRETRMRSFVDEHGDSVGLILVVRDISQRKAAEAALTEQARTDALTGLPNRRAFVSRLEYLQGEIGSGQGAGCVAVLDIDFFKAVNDRHGHSTGDRVLTAVADAARKVLRSSDLIARVGGEEFGLVLWGVDLEQATRTCERVRASIAGCGVPLASGGSIQVTASLGIAQITANGTSSGAYDAADQALYRAKEQGRDRLQIAA